MERLARRANPSRTGRHIAFFDRRPHERERDVRSLADLAPLAGGGGSYSSLRFVEIWNSLVPDVLEPIIQDLVIPEVFAGNQEGLHVSP
jgi:hypothetical protein